MACLSACSISILPIFEGVCWSWRSLVPRRSPSLSVLTLTAGCLRHHTQHNVPIASCLTLQVCATAHNQRLLSQRHLIEQLPINSNSCRRFISLLTQTCELTISTAESPPNKHHDALHPQPLPLKEGLPVEDPMERGFILERVSVPGRAQH